MPVTPFHFGPGAAIHALAPRHISFVAFCAANVLIDIEPLYFMLTGQYPLHRFFHTYVGASCITLVTALLLIAGLKLASRLRWPDVLQLQGLHALPIWLGAALGSYSHIVLDSVMHADIVPLAPFSRVNALYQCLPLETLHLACVGAALFALVLMGLRWLRRNMSD